MDPAASELFDETDGKYHFPGESKMCGKEIVRTSEEMVDYLTGIINNSSEKDLSFYYRIIKVYKETFS